MKKLLVCDVEGTIFKAPFKIAGTDYASTMWQPIAKKLGEAALEEERLTHQKWDNREYAGYLDWVKATIDIHRKYSLKQPVFDELINAAEYNPGVEEFFDALDRNIWIPVLISGGFKNLIRRAQNELDIDYGYGACEYYFDKHGYLEHYSLQPADFDGKISSLKGLIKELGLNYATDWVFVGDGKNDEEIAKKAPMAFAINPHEILKKIDRLIVISSFMDILPHLNSVAKIDKTEKTVLPNQAPEQPKPKDPAGMLNRRVVDLISFHASAVKS